MRFLSQSGEVRKAGLRIRVQQQPLKLLEILLERPGEVVTREELRGRVWTNETFGDFDQALNIAIASFELRWRTRLRIRDSSRRFQNVAIALLPMCRLSTQTPTQKSRRLRLESCLAHKKRRPGLDMRPKSPG
jgi:Transcriptional regulatory protein, C terminal